MKIYDPKGNSLGGISHVEDRTLKREINVLPIYSFFVNRELQNKLPLEAKIETPLGFFIIKEKKKSGERYEYIARPDVSALQADLVTKAYATQTVKQMATDLLAGTGWSIISTATEKRTVTLKERTRYEGIYEIVDRFKYEIDWNITTKTITIEPRIGRANAGLYIHDQVGLRDVTVSADSYDLITRIVPRGKGGIGIEPINGGLPYLENKTYSSQTKTFFWSDERYTVLENLKADARKKLDELAIPRQSFEVDLIDLAKLDPAKWSAQAFTIGDTVDLISTREGIREKQRIVEWTENLDQPGTDTITIANVLRDYRTETENELDNLRVATDVTRASLELLDEGVSIRVTNIVNNAIEPVQQAADAAQAEADAAAQAAAAAAGAAQEAQNAADAAQGTASAGVADAAAAQAAADKAAQDAAAAAAEASKAKSDAAAAQTAAGSAAQAAADADAQAEQAKADAAAAQQRADAAQAEADAAAAAAAAAQSTADGGTADAAAAKAAAAAAQAKADQAKLDADAAAAAAAAADSEATKAKEDAAQAAADAAQAQQDATAAGSAAAAAQSTANAASSAASKAQKDATAAGSAASAAKNAADAAQTTADAANTAAVNAQADATTAIGNAAAAQSKANEATGKAETAQGKADAAASAAATAQNAADAADAAAIAAQGTADEAATAAAAAQARGDAAAAAAAAAQAAAEAADAAAAAAQAQADAAAAAAAAAAATANAASTAITGINGAITNLGAGLNKRDVKIADTLMADVRRAYATLMAQIGNVEGNDDLIAAVNNLRSAFTSLENIYDSAVADGVITDEEWAQLDGATTALGAASVIVEEQLAMAINTELGTLAESISNVVLELDADSIMSKVTSTETWTGAMSSIPTAENIGKIVDNKILTYDTTATQTREAFERTINAAISENNELIQDKTRYFREDMEGLHIGLVGSPFSTRLSEDMLAFLEGDVAAAWIQRNNMYIEHVVAKTSLTVGKHRLETYNNNVTIGRWIGGS